MAFAPDYGLKLKTQGASADFDVHLVDFRLYDIAVVGSDLFTTMVNMNYDGEMHAATFDFNTDILMQIYELYPDALAKFIEDGKAGNWFQGYRGEFAEPLALSIHAKLGEPQMAEQEQYVPLVIQSVKKI